MANLPSIAVQFYTVVAMEIDAWNNPPYLISIYYLWLPV